MAQKGQNPTSWGEKERVSKEIHAEPLYLWGTRFKTSMPTLAHVEIHWLVE